MKKVIIISSSPRENGNSETLCRSFAKGAEDAGNSVEFVSIRDLNMSPCDGCYKCVHLGKCKKDDGANELAEKFMNAEVVCVASPVYLQNMCAQMKIFIDRMIQLYYTNRAPHSDCYIITTAFRSSLDDMELTVKTIRESMHTGYGCTIKGELKFNDLGKKITINEHPDWLKQAYDMGYNC